MAWLVVGLVVVIVLVLLLNGLTSALEQEQDIIIPDRQADDEYLIPCVLCGREAEHYCEIHAEFYCDADWPWHTDVCSGDTPVIDQYGYDAPRGIYA